MITQTCDIVAQTELALNLVCHNNNNNNNNDNALSAWPTVQLTVHITVIFGSMCLTGRE